MKTFTLLRGLTTKRRLSFFALVAICVVQCAPMGAQGVSGLGQFQSFTVPNPGVVDPAEGRVFVPTNKGGARQSPGTTVVPKANPCAGCYIGGEFGPSPGTIDWGVPAGQPTVGGRRVVGVITAPAPTERKLPKGYFRVVNTTSQTVTINLVVDKQLISIDFPPDLSLDLSLQGSENIYAVVQAAGKQTSQLLKADTVFQLSVDGGAYKFAQQ